MLSTRVNVSDFLNDDVQFSRYFFESSDFKEIQAIFYAFTVGLIKTLQHFEN